MITNPHKKWTASFAIRESVNMAINNPSSEHKVPDGTRRNILSSYISNFHTETGIRIYSRTDENRNLVVGVIT